MKTKNMIHGLLLAPLLITPASFAAPLAPQQLPADTQWVVHADLARFKQTKMGEHLLKQVAGAAEQAKIDAFSAMFQLDPRTDLDSFTLAGSGPEEEQAVLMLTGKFKGEHLITLVKGHEAYETKVVKGHTVHSWIDDKHRKGSGKRSFGTVYENRLLILSSRADNVAGVMDVLNGKQTSLATGNNQELKLDSGESIFFMAAANLEGLEQVNPQAQILQKARSGYFSLGETAGDVKAEMVIQTDSPESAAQMQAIVQGLVAMLAFNAEQEPELVRLAQRFKTAAAGNALNMNLAIPVADIIRMGEAKRSMRKQRSLPDL